MLFGHKPNSLGFLDLETEINSEFLPLKLIWVVVSKIFLCSSLFAEMIQFDDHIFQKGLKPPGSYETQCLEDEFIH